MTTPPGSCSAPDDEVRLHERAGKRADRVTPARGVDAAERDYAAAVEAESAALASYVASTTGTPAAEAAAREALADALDARDAAVSRLAVLARAGLAGGAHQPPGRCPVSAPGSPCSTPPPREAGDVVTTRHTCNDGRGPAFGRRTAGCPRCDELAAGAEPVRWRPSRREQARLDDEQRAAEIRSHVHDAGCGGIHVCTFGDW